MPQLKLTSPVFSNQGTIPDKYGYRRQNVNPPLEIKNVPEAAQSLVLIMDDPDAIEPAGKVWDHWVVWNIPAETEEIDEGSLPQEAVEGQTDYGQRTYGGPNPPDKVHTYRFRLYAVDKKLELTTSATKDDVLQEMEDHALEKTTLEGKYAP